MNWYQTKSEVLSPSDGNHQMVRVKLPARGSPCPEYLESIVAFCSQCGLTVAQEGWPGGNRVLRKEQNAEWAGFAQTNGKLIALLLPQFIVLFLISGNIISSLLVGASGLLIIAVIWGIIRGVRKKTAS